VIEVSQAGEFSMSGDNFFKNAGPINFVSADESTTLISNCCFLRYTETGPGRVEYDNYMFAGKGSVNFTKTYINLVFLDRVFSLTDVSGEVSKPQSTSTTLSQRAEECRLQPLQTLTPELKFGEAAWFSIISIVFFVIVSVVGIVVVTCSQSDESALPPARDAGRDGSAKRGRSDDSDQSLSSRD
jgi:hypothetical protein